MAEKTPLDLGKLPSPPELTKVSPVAPAWPTNGFHSLLEVKEPLQRGLLEYRFVLWRKKGLIAAGLLIGALLGGLVTICQEPTYVVRTTLEFQPRVNPGPLAATETREAYDESAIATYEHVLQSRSLREKVIDRLKQGSNAQKFSEAGNSSLLMQAVEKIGLSAGTPTKSTYKAALAQAAETLKAKTVPQTRILEISCESASPKIAAEFANGIVGEFMDEDLQSHWNSTQSTNKKLTEELQQLRAKLAESEQNLNNYAQKTGITFASPNSTLIDDELKRTQQDLAAAIGERVSKEARYKIATEAPQEGLADPASDPLLQNYRSQLSDLNRQLAELNSTFTPAYAKTKRVQAQITELEQAIARERSVALERIKSEYDEASRREAMLMAEYRKHASAASAEAQRILQYTTLKNDFEANRQLYESVLQKVRELDIASAMHASNIRVIDAAEVPSDPARPNPIRNLGLGLFSGLVCAIGLVFWKDYVHSSLWAPGEGPMLFNLPELGVIPSSKLDKYPQVYGKIKQLGLHSSTLSKASKGGGDSIELASLQEQPSLIAESFRRTIASLLFSRNQGARPKVVVVTSPGCGDGKSTLSSNLAIALAEIRLRVLLIDTDLRSPRLHTIFDVANTWGISNLLEETTSIPVLPAQALYRETKIPNLFLLTSGPPVASISKLLFSDRLEQLIARYRMDFDFIVVDTPPVLQVSDARAVARHADGVVLVLRSGYSKLKAAMASINVLSQDGSPILGTVLNDWNPRTGGSEDFHDLYYNSHHQNTPL